MASSEEERLLRRISGQLDSLLILQRLIHRERLDEELGRLLGDGTRRRIYDLCDGSRSVGEMAAALNVSSPAVSQHLAALASAGLVTQADAPPKHYFRRLDLR